MGCGPSAPDLDHEAVEPQHHAISPTGVAGKEMIPVAVPAGADPGAVIQFQIPDGRWIQVTVPQGAGPGSTLSVEVPVMALPQQVQYRTLVEAFKYCDPEETGYITDHTRFAKVAKALANLEGNQAEVWSTLDLDGNGKVSWPEFVEWAEVSHVELALGVDEEGGALSFPSTWTGPQHDPTHVSRDAVKDTAHFRELAQLMQVTYKKIYTRDRKATGTDKVPDGYDLVKAWHCEHFKDWRRYYLRRHQLLKSCSRKTGFMSRPSMTNQATGLIRRQALRGSCNEWLLFHGTSKKNADKIVEGAHDFHIGLAGTATGTLYGRGAYFADSITKADEYAKEEDGLCCVLVCRIIGGHVLYHDEVTPDPEKLQGSCISGEYNSVLGDREKCRNTFKEYVIYDADQVYVEYVLHYKRRYD